MGELIRPLIPSVHSTRSLAIQRLYTLQRRIELRIEGKIIRREFTDAIKDYIARHPELSDNRKQWMYVNASEKINLLLFGAFALGVPEG